MVDVEGHVLLESEDTVQGDVAYRHRELRHLIGNGSLVQGVPSGEGLVKDCILRRVGFYGDSLAVVVFFGNRQGRSRAGDGSLVRVGNGILVAGMELVHRELTVGTHFTGGYGIHGAADTGYRRAHNGGIQSKAFVHTDGGRNGRIGGAGAVYGFSDGIGAVQILHVMDRLIGNAGVGGEVAEQLNVPIGHCKGSLIRRDRGIGGLPSGEGVAGIGKIGSHGYVGAESHIAQAGRCRGTRIVSGDRISHVMLVRGKRALEYDILLGHGIAAVGGYAYVGSSPAAEGVAVNHGNIVAHRGFAAGQTVLRPERHRLFGDGIGILIGNGIGLNVGGIHGSNRHTCGIQKIRGTVVGRNLAVLNQGGMGVDHIIIGGSVDLDDQGRSVIIPAVLRAGRIGNVVFVIVEAVHLHRLSLHGAAQSGVRDRLGPAPATVCILHAVRFVQRYGIRTVGDGEEGGHGIHHLCRLTQLNGGRLDLLSDGLENHLQGFGGAGHHIVTGRGIPICSGGCQVGGVGIVAGYVVEKFIQIGGGVVYVCIRSHADGIHLRGLLDILGQVDRRIGNAGIKTVVVVGFAVGEHQHHLIALCGSCVGGSQYHLRQGEAVVNGGGAAGSQRVYRRDQRLVTGTVGYRQILDYLGIVIAGSVLVVAFRHGGGSSVVAVGGKLNNGNAVLERFKRSSLQSRIFLGDLGVLLMGSFNKSINRRLQCLHTGNGGGDVGGYLLGIELHHAIIVTAVGIQIVAQLGIHVYSPVVFIRIGIIVAVIRVRIYTAHADVMRCRGGTDIYVIGSACRLESVVGFSAGSKTTAPATSVCLRIGGNRLRSGGKHVVHGAGYVQHKHDIRRNGRGGLRNHTGGVRFNDYVHRSVGLAVFLVGHSGLSHNDTVRLVGVFHNGRLHTGLQFVRACGKYLQRHHRYEHHSCQKSSKNTFCHQLFSLPGLCPIFSHHCMYTSTHVSANSAEALGVRSSGLSFLSA